MSGNNLNKVRTSRYYGNKQIGLTTTVIWSICWALCELKTLSQASSVSEYLCVHWAEPKRKPIESCIRICLAVVGPVSSGDSWTSHNEDHVDCGFLHGVSAVFDPTDSYVNGRYGIHWMNAGGKTLFLLLGWLGWAVFHGRLDSTRIDVPDTRVVQCITPAFRLLLLVYLRLRPAPPELEPE